MPHHTHEVIRLKGISRFVRVLPEPWNSCSLQQSTQVDWNPKVVNTSDTTNGVYLPSLPPAALSLFCWALSAGGDLMLFLVPGPAAALSTADEGSSCSLQAVYATTCHLRSTVQQNKGSFRHLIVVGNRLFAQCQAPWPSGPVYMENIWPGATEQFKNFTYKWLATTKASKIGFSYSHNSTLASGTFFHSACQVWLFSDSPEFLHALGLAIAHDCETSLLDPEVQKQRTEKGLGMS